MFWKSTSRFPRPTLYESIDFCVLLFISTQATASLTSLSLSFEIKVVSLSFVSFPR